MIAPIRITALQWAPPQFQGQVRDLAVRWALEESGLRELALASAFQAEGTCVMHMATRIRPDVPVLFLDTGMLFGQTLDYRKQLTARLGLTDVRDLRPRVGLAGDRMRDCMPVRRTDGEGPQDEQVERALQQLPLHGNVAASGHQISSLQQIIYLKAQPLCQAKTL